VVALRYSASAALQTMGRDFFLVSIKSCARHSDSIRRELLAVQSLLTPFWECLSLQCSDFHSAHGVLPHSMSWLCKVFCGRPTPIETMKKFERQMEDLQHDL